MYWFGQQTEVVRWETRWAEGMVGGKRFMEGDFLFFFLDFLGGSFADGAAAWLNGSNLRLGEIFSP